MIAGILTKVVSKAISVGTYGGTGLGKFGAAKWASKVIYGNTKHPPKLYEYSKNLEKFGPKGMKPDGEKLMGLEKAMVDERISHLVRPPFKLDVTAAMKELPTDKHLRYEYLTNVLSKVHKKDEVRALIKYVKSAAAENLPPDKRADLMIKCLDKLKYIDHIAPFLG